MKRERRTWTMPDWMERFRTKIINTGGNAVEEMMVDDSDPQINLPRAVLAACVKSQVGLLEILHKDGVL
jgi:hypothetical protein